MSGRTQRRHPQKETAPDAPPGRENMPGNTVPITSVHTQITRNLTSVTHMVNDLFDNIYAMDRKIAELTARLQEKK